MTKSKSPQNVINQYKKSQKIWPMVMWVIAVVLVVAGLIFLLVWLFGSGGPSLSFFATDTPTPTLTFTPTNTAVPTENSHYFPDAFRHTNPHTWSTIHI